MAAKYYTHFLTEGGVELESPATREWSGVVELSAPLRERREMGELRSLLAVNFDLDCEDIRILHWARLH